MQDAGFNAAEIMQIAIFSGTDLSMSVQKRFVLSVAGDTEKIDALEKLLRQYGVRELVRTGRIAILRGTKIVKSAK